MGKESCFNCIYLDKIGSCETCGHPDNYDKVGNILEGRNDLICRYMKNGCPMKKEKKENAI